MNRKVIHVINKIRPGGGPAGYLYNLHAGLNKTQKETNFRVRSSLESSERESKYFNIEIPNIIARNIKPLWHLVQLLGLKNQKVENLVDNLDDIYVSHVVTHAATLRRVYNKKIKLFLMPHAPVSYSEEVISDITLKHGKSCFKDIYLKLMMHAEKRAISQMNGVIVAAKEGLEGYFQGEGIKNKPIFEVKSGVPEFTSNVDKAEARQLLNLPADSTIFGYFGRYNTDKGYDIYYDAAKITSDISRKIFFISAGIGPLKRPAFDHYKDFGWRKDINLLITAVDAVIIPNRNTYFDLLPLEALSLKRPVIVSNIGGNKKLAHDCPSVINFGTKTGELAQALIKFSKNESSNSERIEVQARKDYEDNYSIETFLTNHEGLAKEIINFTK